MAKYRTEIDHELPEPKVFLKHDRLKTVLSFSEAEALDLSVRLRKEAERLGHFRKLKDQESKPRIYAVDFDGTIVEHEFPMIGPPVPGALEALKTFELRGDQVILHTMRSGEYLLEALGYLDKHGVSLYGVNKNPDQSDWTQSLKPYAHRYIDDSAVGVPLVRPEGRRPYVDWQRLMEMLDELDAWKGKRPEGDSRLVGSEGQPAVRLP